MMASRTLLALVAVVVGTPAFGAAPTPARCTAAEAPEVGRAVRATLDRCGDADASKASTLDDAPACLGPFEVAARALAAPLCGLDSNLSVEEKRCQAAIARAAGQFVEGRLIEISERLRATRHARVMDAIVPGCRALRVRRSKMSDHPFVPALGAPCQNAGGLEGDPFDAVAAARCVRGALSELANRSAPEPLRPNFVVVLTDDQRWDTLRYMPKLTQELTERGVTYRNAFVNTPVCAPSRASFLSGRYATANGVRINAAASDSFDEATSIAPRLNEAGYRTGLVGIYLADLGEGVPAGWENWYALRSSEQHDGGGFPTLRFRDGDSDEILPPTQFDEITDRLHRKALDFLDASAQEPFLLWVGMIAPHAPAIAAERYAGRFSDLAPWRPTNWREEDVDDKPTWLRFLKAISKPEGVQRVDDLRIAQLRSLLAVDDAVAGLSARLEELGLTDETVFIFTSDNGHFWGEHWLSAKFAPYEEAIRVPLVVRYPRLVGTPRTIDDLVLNVDLAWTLADLAGIPPIGAGPGQSLVPSLEGEPLAREEILIEAPGGLIAKPSLALRTKRWKYIRTDADAGIVEELYDLGTDPFEMDNLAAVEEHRATKKRMRSRLDELTREFAPQSGSSS